MRGVSGVALPLIALTAAAIAACGGGHHGSKSFVVPPGLSGLVGVVLDYTDAPLRGVPVRLVDSSGGGLSASTGPDGRFFLAPLQPGAHALEVGDGKKFPALTVAFDAATGPGFLERPVFLPSFESGPQASVPANVGNT